MKKIEKQYEQVYWGVRGLAQEVAGAFGKNPEGGPVVAGALAEVLSKTLKSYTLRCLKKEHHAQYLHRLISVMLADILKGSPHLTGRILIAERGQRKKKG